VPEVTVRVPPRAYEMLAYVSSVTGKSVEEVIEEILEGLAVRSTKEDVIAYLAVSGKLKEYLVGLGRMVGELSEEVRRLAEEVRRVWGELTAVRSDLRVFTRVDQQWGGGCSAFARELGKHGLLSMSKRWLRGEDVPELYKLLNDDAFYRLIACRDEVLAADLEELGEPRRLEWVA